MDDAVKPKFGLYEMITVTVDVSLSFDFILFLVLIEFEILFRRLVIKTRENLVLFPLN